VRLLVYSNEYDVEGLVATTSTWLKQGTREDLIRRHLAAYAEVRPNLLKHAPGFPAVESCSRRPAPGRPPTAWPASAIARARPVRNTSPPSSIVRTNRPVWVTVWGGANTLAQTLWDVRATRTPEELARFVAKLRVYSVSDQDDAGPWLRREFPGLFYIVSPSAAGRKRILPCDVDRHFGRPPWYKNWLPGTSSTGGQSLARGKRHQEPRSARRALSAARLHHGRRHAHFPRAHRPRARLDDEPGLRRMGRSLRALPAVERNATDLDEQSGQPRHGHRRQRHNRNHRSGDDLALARALSKRLCRAHGLVRRR
jgi:hypothetical protein